MTDLLKVENLRVSFSTLSKKISVLRGVSFDLQRGKTLGIVGESGCGKSVTARAITGLLPSISSKIDNGRILYCGEDLIVKKEREMIKIRGKEIGMIFQDPMTALNPTMRIRDQITEGYALHYPKTTNKEIEEHALDLLEQVGISEGYSRLKQYPHELSGGIRQRIMIATAMMTSPNILIADEPTTALDVTVQAEILELLKTMQEKKGMGIILITHDLGVVADFCDRVVVMYAGQIVESAPVEKLFHTPKHPYTRRLLASIPRLDHSSKTKLYSIGGIPPDLSTKIQGCPFAKRCPDAMHVCYKEKATNYSFDTDHHASCWLFDPRAQCKKGSNK